MSDLRPSLASGAGTTPSRRQRRTHNASLQLVPGVRLAEVILRESPRAGLGDIPRLADSIKANGLLQPIVVTPDKVLVFGHRRLVALKRLGWQSAPFVEVTDRFEALKVADEQRHEHTEERLLLPSEIGSYAQFISDLESDGLLQIRTGQRGGRTTEEASEAMAKIFGLGHTKLSQILSTMKRAEKGDLLALTAVGEMDMTGRVDAAHKKYLQLRRTHAIEESTQDLQAGEEPVLPPEALSSQERRIKLVQMAGEGYSSRQIAKILDYSEATVVRRIAKDMGVKITADAVVGKSKKHNSTRIVAETVSGLEGTVMALDLVDYEDLELESRTYWLESITSSLQSLTKFRNTLKELER